MRLIILIICVVIVAGLAGIAMYHPGAWWWFLLAGPLVLVAIYDMVQPGDNVSRNFPWMGHIKQLIVKVRPLAQDWLLQNTREGRPFNTIERNIVVSRARGKVLTSPFGTQYDYYSEGYEWMLHSTVPTREKITEDLRVHVGTDQCSQPYSASILNVSAMSYGSISANATMALNGGAKLGNFASNTGEGGLTEYHLKYGGDLIFQFGTAYFGCRTPDGNFDPEKFREKATHPNVKLVEIKISQGAKPGYGAILPGKKVTPEIADIRGVKPYETIFSPPGHTTFETPIQLLQFVATVRDLSGGKPTGFKFCLGQPYEFIAICKAIIKTGIKPDFITIDGGEGGTGAAHFESMHYVGMPILDAIVLAADVLEGFGLKNDVRLFAAGKITSAFHVARFLAMGADACYSARAMMFSLGCVQAMQCNEDTCPTGITTMRKSLTAGLVPENKKEKVFNFHRNTVIGVKELLESAGIKELKLLRRKNIARRISHHQWKTLDEIYPHVRTGSFLEGNIPESLKSDFEIADPETFHPAGFTAGQFKN